jgi:hypothetical protein
MFSGTGCIAPTMFRLATLGAHFLPILLLRIRQAALRFKQCAWDMVGFGQIPSDSLKSGDWGSEIPSTLPPSSSVAARPSTAGGIEAPPLMCLLELHPLQHWNPAIVHDCIVERSPLWEMHSSKLPLVAASWILARSSHALS